MNRLAGLLVGGMVFCAMAANASDADDRRALTAWQAVDQGGLGE